MSIKMFLSFLRNHLALKLAVRVTMLIWLSLAAICYVRYITVPQVLSPKSCSPNSTDFINGTERDLIGRLSQAIRFQTVSYDRNNTNLEEMAKLRNFIQESFPVIHSSPFIKREVVNSHSLLYTVTGSDLDLKPYMLVAHMDVVPAEESQWDLHPFAGIIKNGSLYGRGTLDVKNILMGTLEALEFALENGFQPRRTFYLAFGHDEEVSGFQGAAHISALLQSRGVQLEFLLDEGLFVVKDMVPGISEPVALIGVAEKGYLTLKLSVSTSGGHSSTAPLETAVVVLAKALSKLKGNVHPSQFGKGPEKDMLEQAAPYAKGLFRFIYSNMWLFSSAVAWVFEQNPATSANIRTTTAVTMVGGGIKENVIPTSAWAIVNHRIFPSQSIKEIMDLDAEIIGDPRVKLELLTAHEAVKSSPYGEGVFGWQVLERTIKEIYPTSPVLPSLLPARTDSAWYTNLTSGVYRFAPVNLSLKQVPLFHGPNENIRISNYEQVVNFYHRLMENLNSNSSDCKTMADEHQEL